MREGGRARPSSGTLGGQRGRAERYGKVQEIQRTRTAQETVRKWHPVTARGNAHPLRRRVRLMLRVGMHRCSQQVPSMHTHTHMCVCVCVCVCIHHFIYHLLIPYFAFERKFDLVSLCGCACDTTLLYVCVCVCEGERERKRRARERRWLRRWQGWSWSRVREDPEGNARSSC